MLPGVPVDYHMFHQPRWVAEDSPAPPPPDPLPGVSCPVCPHDPPPPPPFSVYPKALESLPEDPYGPVSPSDVPVGAAAPLQQQ